MNNIIETGYQGFMNGVHVAQNGLYGAAHAVNNVGVAAANGINSAYNTYDNVTNPWRWFGQPQKQLVFYDNLYSAFTNPFYFPNMAIEAYGKNQQN